MCICLLVLSASSPRTRITEAMELKLECAPAVPVGEAIQVVCRAKNNDKLPHDVTISVRASSVVYNNAAPEEVGCTSQRLKMAPGTVEPVELKMNADSYMGKLRPQGMIRIDAVASFKDGFATARAVVIVEMPPLNVEASLPLVTLCRRPAYIINIQCVNDP
ncbi:unnamed protein product [Ixodes pacificus]